jgi:hypothetical protein
MNRPTDMLQSKSVRPMRGLREILSKFTQCLRDERGVAMTEYIIISSLVTLTCSFYLFDPNNGFYYAARNQYNITTLLLQFPGP